MKARASSQLSFLQPETTDSGTPASLRVLATPAGTSPPAAHTQRQSCWLVLHFPRLPLHAVRKPASDTERTANARPNPPPNTHPNTHPVIAVVDTDRQRRVLCCNEPALRAGIRPGHTFNAAIALCSDAQLHLRDTAAEMALLTTIALTCHRYTPMVSIEPPNEILLEVRGSLHLFGGAQPLVQRLQSELQAQGWEPRIALADTARGAQWLARCAREPRLVSDDLPTALAALPVHVLHWPEQTEQKLERWGITCIGDLLRLPRGGLARRIGQAHLRELDAALGKHPDLRRPVDIAPRYRDRVNLDFDIETTTLLAKLLGFRLERLGRFLRRRTLEITHLEIELHHRDVPLTPVRVGLATATADMRHVHQLLHEILSALTLAAPVCAVTVLAENLQAAQLRTLEIALPGAPRTDSSSPAEAEARLLEQLRVKLGEQAIRTLVLKEDHRPEQTQTTRPAMLSTATLPAGTPSAPRPLWLLPEPQPVSSKTRHHWRLDAGPERIESGWWDGAPIVRDYFIVTSPDGSQGWVFQDHGPRGRWYLHGLFA